MTTNTFSLMNPTDPHRFVLCYRRWIVVVFVLLLSLNSVAQAPADYEEVPLSLNVPRLGSTEIFALIKKEEAYLPVKDLFDYLKIKNAFSAGMDSIFGFFINQEAQYVVDYRQLQITHAKNQFKLLQNDIIATETGLYLRSEIFKKVFGLDCTFSFRNLNVTLKTQLELPAVKEMQLEQMRRNVHHLKGEKKADTSIGKQFKMLHVGVADWTVSSMQETNGANSARFNLAVGATLAGGEAEFNLNYFTEQAFDARQQSFRWRHVNNKFAPLRQVVAGRLYSPTVSSVFAPINGIQLTNTPTNNRKSFGTYRYTGNTQPGWTVELYVNNILVDYVKSDASGFYAFDIPILYGNSAIRLKYFGPWGEESTKEESINVPFNFLPAGEFQYLLTAGIISDGKQSRFSRADLNYGLSKKVTIGGGYEYLSTVTEGRPMPFLSASARLGGAVIVSGEYMHKVRSKGTLNYRLPSNLQLDMAIIKYDKAQTALWTNYLQERKAALTMPFRIKGVSAFSKVSFNQYIWLKSKMSNIELLLSSVIAGVSSNVRTFAQFSHSVPPVIQSNVSASFMLPEGIRFTPQVQYQYHELKFALIKAEAEKRISNRGFVNLSYEKNLLANHSNITLGLRYNLSFAQTHFSVRKSKDVITTTQFAKGSLMYEGQGNYHSASNQPAVGRGGLIVMPFLDINCNGRKDINEPKAFGLNVRINGGRVKRNIADSTLVITGLESYASYHLELDKSSFDNIAWQIKHATISVLIEPNRLKIVEVPVSVVGEASGMVYLLKAGKRIGLSRMLVNFHDSLGNVVAKTLSEGDGYFNFLGLPPGSYIARVDSAQLKKLGMISVPGSIAFKLAGTQDGAMSDGFEFVLKLLSEPLELSADTITDPKMKTGNAPVIAELLDKKHNEPAESSHEKSTNPTNVKSKDSLIVSKRFEANKIEVTKVGARKYDSKSTRQHGVKPHKTSKVLANEKKATRNITQRKPVATSSKPIDAKQQQGMRKMLQKQQPASNLYERWLRPFRTIDTFNQ